MFPDGDPDRVGGGDRVLLLRVGHGGVGQRGDRHQVHLVSLLRTHADQD